MKKELELYIHIPFCAQKCAYCDFLSWSRDPETMAQYVEVLLKEMEAQREEYKDYVVTSIFIGGGTPSILEGEQILRIMNQIRRAFQVDPEAEITMEANPGTVSKEKFLAYKEAGIHRISFGLQSANDKELKLLGRIHSYEEFLKGYQEARACGFDNINIDLISAIPDQTLESWKKTLEDVVALEPEHISAYSLIVEEETPFYALYGPDGVDQGRLPDEEEERQIYHVTKKILEKHGYERYEISNYAKKGKQCRHNLGYWERKNYLGLGLGAASLIENVRFQNTGELSAYLESQGQTEWLREQKEVLSEEEQMEEFVFLGLRKMSGISLQEFSQIFGTSFEECFGEQMQSLEKEGMLCREQGMLRLTDEGIDVSNYVFARLLS